jgi:hypothetical protein
LCSIAFNNLTTASKSSKSSQSPSSYIALVIRGKNSGICLTEKSLKAQRDKLFTENNFESKTYLKTYNVAFLGEFLYDVSRIA